MSCVLYNILSYNSKEVFLNIFQYYYKVNTNDSAGGEYKMGGVV